MQILFGFMILAGLLIMPIGVLIGVYRAISGKGKTWIGWRTALGGLLVVTIGFIGFGLVTPGTSEETRRGRDSSEPAMAAKARQPARPPRPAGTPTLTADQTKSLARTDITYDSLARNTEDFVGQSVYYRGEIVQVMERGGDRLALRVNINRGEHGFWTDTIFVNYEGPRVLEDDIVDIWGTVVGRQKYTAVLGQQIVIPEVTAMYLELVPVEAEAGLKLVPEGGSEPVTTPASGTSPPGSRGSPVPIGETLEFDDEGKRIQLTLVEVLRGEEAAALMAERHRQRLEGSDEFMADAFQARYVLGPADASYKISDYSFGIEVDHVVQDAFTWGTQEDALGAELYPGGETRGWVAFSVPAHAEIQGVYYQKEWDVRLWFSTAQL